MQLSQNKKLSKVFSDILPDLVKGILDMSGEKIYGFDKLIVTDLFYSFG